MTDHRSPRPARALLAVGAAVAVATALAGCSVGGDSGSPGTSASAAASAPAATSASAAAAPSSSPSASTAGGTTTTTSSQAAQPSTAASTTGYRSARCTADHLTGALGSTQGAAGSTVVPLVLHNTGSTPCTLQGWPGVSFVAADGSQIGASAALDRSSAHQTVTLLADGHAQALLRIADAGNFSASSCQPVDATRLRVYPPGSTESIIVRIPTTSACRSTRDALLTTQAFTPTS